MTGARDWHCQETGGTAGRLGDPTAPLIASMNSSQRASQSSKRFIAVVGTIAPHSTLCSAASRQPIQRAEMSLLDGYIPHGDLDGLDQVALPGPMHGGDGFQITNRRLGRLLQRE